LCGRRIRSFSAKVGKELRGAGARLPRVSLLAQALSKPQPTAKNFSAGAQNHKPKHAPQRERRRD